MMQLPRKRVRFSFGNGYEQSSGRLWIERDLIEILRYFRTYRDFISKIIAVPLASSGNLSRQSQAQCAW